MATRHVWDVFRDLASARQYGMAPNPIPFSEIDAYCRLRGLRLEGWEIDLIRTLDGIALSGAEGQRSQPDPAAVSEADVAEVKARIRSAGRGRRIVKRQAATE